MGKGYAGIYIGKHARPMEAAPPPLAPHASRRRMASGDPASYLDKTSSWGIAQINLPDTASQSDTQNAVQWVEGQLLGSLIDNTVVYNYIATTATSQWVYDKGSLVLTVLDALTVYANPPTTLGIGAGLDDANLDQYHTQQYNVTINGCNNFVSSFSIGTGDDLGSSSYYLGFYRQDSAGNVYLMDSANLSNPGDFAPYEGSILGIWNQSFWADDSSQYFLNLYAWNGSSWNLQVSSPSLNAYHYFTPC